MDVSGYYFYSFSVDTYPIKVLSRFKCSVRLSVDDDFAIFIDRHRYHSFWYKDSSLLECSLQSLFSSKISFSFVAIAM